MPFEEPEKKAEDSKIAKLKQIPSTLGGSFLILLGSGFPVLWLLDYIGIIRKGTPDPLAWPILVMSAGSIGFGWLLINNEGRTIADVFMSWFGRRRDD